MSDLFGDDPRWRKGGSKVERAPPWGPKGKDEGGAPCPGGAKVPQPSSELSFRTSQSNARRASRPEKEIGLRQELVAVYLGLEEANEEVEKIAPTASRYAMQFSHADLALRNALAERSETGQPRYLFEFYDARVAAGHAWHPFRKRLEDALRWRKSLMDAAQAINKELGI